MRLKGFRTAPVNHGVKYGLSESNRHLIIVFPSRKDSKGGNEEEGVNE